MIINFNPSSDFLPPPIFCKYLDGECFEYGDKCKNCEEKKLFYKGNEESLFIENIIANKNEDD